MKPTEVYAEHPASNFGFFEEAFESARNALVKHSSVLQDQTPLPLDDCSSTLSEMIVRSGSLADYFCENGNWLKNCAENINTAIQTGNEAFFLRLAEVIANRPTYRGKSPIASLFFRKPTDPRPKRRTDMLRILMAQFWTEWPLWLMPDPVGCAYLTRFTDMEITEQNYKKLRQRLALFQHPDRPVTAFTVEGKPLLRFGWTKPKL